MIDKSRWGELKPYTKYEAIRPGGHLRTGCMMRNPRPISRSRSGITQIVCFRLLTILSVYRSWIVLKCVADLSRSICMMFQESAWRI